MDVQFKVLGLKRDAITGAVVVVEFEAFLDSPQRPVMRGGVPLDAPNPDSFIPYMELTEAQVVEWVKSKLGAEKLGRLEKFLVQLKDHPMIRGLVTGTPW